MQPICPQVQDEKADKHTSQVHRRWERGEIARWLEGGVLEEELRDLLEGVEGA